MTVRHLVIAFALIGCRGSSNAPTSGPAPTNADEVPTPTEKQPTQAAAPPSQAVAQPAQAPAPPIAFPATCKAIAKDLAALGKDYPQLASFKDDGTDCAIFHDFDTHPPTTRGGWSSAVPQPNDHGVWFYVGIYDPNGPEANSQIHMQPVVPNWWIGDRKVMFLILEGKKTKSVADAIMHVLEHHGMALRH